MDGEEGNDPVVISTFNHTPKAVSKDIREYPQGEDGKLEQSDKGFDKFVVGGEKVHPNIALRTKKEKGEKGFKHDKDPSGDMGSLDEADGNKGEKAPNKSAHAERRMEKEMKKEEEGNVESQEYQIPGADGMCGTTKHAKDDVKRIMKEKMPSEESRFKYNDVVWNKFTSPVAVVAAKVRR